MEGDARAAHSCPSSPTETECSSGFSTLRRRSVNVTEKVRQNKDGSKIQVVRESAVSTSSANQPNQSVTFQQNSFVYINGSPGEIQSHLVMLIILNFQSPAGLPPQVVAVPSLKKHSSAAGRRHSLLPPSPHPPPHTLPWCQPLGNQAQHTKKNTLYLNFDFQRDRILLAIWFWIDWWYGGPESVARPQHSAGCCLSWTHCPSEQHRAQYSDV